MAPTPEIPSLLLLALRQNNPPFVAVPSVVPSTTILIPVSTATQTVIYTPNPAGSSSNPGAIIGGVLGGFLGTILFIFLMWKGCWEPRSQVRDSYDGSSYDSGSMSERSVRIRVGTVSGRGGGGSEFERRVHREVYGDVKRPQRAWLGGRRGERGVQGKRVRRVRSREKRVWRESREKRQEGGLKFNVGDD